MPILSTAQLMLVLWLLVAAAPMATVLLNGSVAVFAAESASTRAVRTETAERENTPIDAEADAPARTAIPFLADLRPVEVFARTAQAMPAASVLHTAVQRHRPRVA